MTIERVQAPAYLAFGETDQVVSPLKTHKMMARWGEVRWGCARRYLGARAA
jgi:hypothetical protein